MEASGSGSAHRGGELSAAARARTRGPDFEPSFRALNEAFTAACTVEDQWQARIVAGLRAVLDFCAADPAAARALTIQARQGNPAEPDRQDEVIAHFAALLRQTAPASQLVAISTGNGLVEAITTHIRGHLLAGEAEQLPATLPDLVYLTLMPYTGFAEARRWASAAPGL